MSYNMSRMYFWKLTFSYNKLYARFDDFKFNLSLNTLMNFKNS